MRRDAPGSMGNKSKLPALKSQEAVGNAKKEIIICHRVREVFQHKEVSDMMEAERKETSPSLRYRCDGGDGQIDLLCGIYVEAIP